MLLDRGTNPNPSNRFHQFWIDWWWHKTFIIINGMNMPYISIQQYYKFTIWVSQWTLESHSPHSTFPLLCITYFIIISIHNLLSYLWVYIFLPRPISLHYAADDKHRSPIKKWEKPTTCQVSIGKVKVWIRREVASLTTYHCTLSNSRNYRILLELLYKIILISFLNLIL